MVSLLYNTQRRLWLNGITTPCLAKKMQSALPRLGPQSNSNRSKLKKGLLSWSASYLDLKRVYASQQTSHNRGFRATGLGLNHWSKFATFCQSTLAVCPLPLGQKHTLVIALHTQQTGIGSFHENYACMWKRSIYQKTYNYITKAYMTCIFSNTTHDCFVRLNDI